MRIPSLFAVIVVALLAAGCAEQQEPVVTSEPSAASTATPTPTPIAETKPALSELVVYPGGIDYVKVGVPVEGRPDDLAIVKYNSAACSAGEPAYIVGWESTYGAGTFFIVTNPDATIRGIRVASAEVSSDKGIHVGSSVEDIVSAYGSAVTVTEDQVNDLYSVTGADGVLVFEVATDRDFDGGDYGAKAGTVLWLLILGPGTAPFSVAYGAYGPCV